MRVCLCFRVFGGAVLASTLAACGHPEQKFAVTVTDESGKPMAGVECAAGFYRPKRSDGPGLDSYVVRETTNAQGKAALLGETVYFNTTVVAKRSGFYDCRLDRMWITGRAGKRWEPWPVELNLVMKKIRNPHPMYAVKPGDGMKFSFPKKEGQPIGFDLLERDWVAPYGKGKVADFLLTEMLDQPKLKEHFPEGKMKMTFSNAADGIVDVSSTAMGGSILLSPQIAPEGEYDSEVVFSSHPQNDGLYPSLEIDQRTWVFRIRSVIDEKGNLVSAMYGKIQGFPQVIFFSHGTAFRMTYYLNATPNDRGLEWDQKTNLFQDLPEKHWPKDS